MAIEILLEQGRTFHHTLQHDLESLFYVIIWIISHMEKPQVELKDAATKLTIRKWSNMESDLRDLGHAKLAHIDDMKRVILPEISSYWEDFKPFIWELKEAFFPIRSADPNCIKPEKMAEILKRALGAVQEPVLPGPSSEISSQDVEMYEYDLLKYGKDHRRGQEEAPRRKRIRTTKPSPPTRPLSTRTRSSRGAGSSRGSSSKPSKLRDSSSSQGQNFGASI